METPPPTRRRWARFSLRTLFVLITLVCIYLGWATNWIRQRHEFLLGTNPALMSYTNDPGCAPWTLRMLGEIGHSRIYFYAYVDDKAKTAESLFPEAQVDEIGCVLELP